jgi:hemerythrin-like domain-containing protein
MTAIAILKQEHRVIERVLDALEAAAGRTAGQVGVGPSFFIEAADFIRGFADEFHHMKEENVLFETLVEHGMPRQGGPVAVMLFEHEQGRRFTRAMHAAAEQWAGGDEGARADVVGNAQGYVQLLRQHIAKEENILFVMAEQFLPPDVQERVLADFVRVERERAAPGTREKYLALADRLAGLVLR